MNTINDEPPDPKLREQQLLYLSLGLDSLCERWRLQPDSKKHVVSAARDFFAQPDGAFMERVGTRESENGYSTVSAALFRMLESELARVEIRNGFPRERIRARLNGDFAAFFRHYYNLSHS